MTARQINDGNDAAMGGLVRGVQPWYWFDGQRLG